ncbi:urate hydroxylase PuuD [Parahaliea maris]|uniref:Urate hydroxylase PuuD n=1 Tax=Parahaliea maris TaxID=2716870 RepID=A0A5C9A5N9_9GAMM|nr:urate hydroxylase PuuD [Parahaliea maris]TXS95312.1 urate hydroxylase PuuD [Parahaliea maris]
MDAYLLDWLQLIFRWLHVITGVAWIGASFYFVWLDNSLEEPPRWKQDQGIKGDLWAIHGGGIYEVAKYQLAPEKMPETLHWFKWEAYSTWLTGMMLMILVFYIGADAYLIDPRVADLSRYQAIAIGIGFLAGGWLLYELLCATPLARNGYLLGAVLIALAVVTTYGLTHLFSGRGAFIHMGAMIGTIMAGNVFRVIMPSQRALVAAIEAGEAPDPAWGAKAKLRSTHNNYLTLPVLFIMISNHYPMTYAHPHNWLVLLAIIAITAFARHYFNLRHKGIQQPWILGAALVATAVLAWVIMPERAPAPAASEQQVGAAQVQTIIHERCASCHSASPSDDVFTVAPAGVMLESMAQIEQWAPRILARSVESTDMPFLNKTGMTQQERNLLGQWIREGAGE